MDSTGSPSPGSPTPSPTSSPTASPSAAVGHGYIFGRVLPGPPTTVSAPEAYTDPGRTPTHGRPWLLANMIASVDGATAVDGRSGGLGAAGDRAVFHTLRDLADVVLVGAGTARAERYGPPRRPGQRIAVVTASGRLDGLERLLASGAAIIVTTEDASIPAGAGEVLRAGTGQVDLASALQLLGERGAAVVLSEGGPQLLAALLAASALDELCLTIAPMLVGGASNRLIARPHPDASLRPLRLGHVLADDEGYLYTRWLVDR